MRFHPLFAGLALLAAGAAHAQSLELSLNDETARVRYATPMWGQQYGRVEVEGGLLYDTDDDVLLDAGMLVYNDSWQSPLELGIGGRFYYVDTGPNELGGLALGGRFMYAPQNWHGLGVGGHAYYAPRIVSFGDADGLTELAARVSYQLMPQANVYVERHDISADLKNGPEVNIDVATTVGVHLRW